MTYARIPSTALAAVGMVATLAGCPKDQPINPPPPPIAPPPPVVTAPPPPPPPPMVQQGPCDAAMQLALQTAIDARSKTELAAGMQKESGFTCMVVPEGGTAQVPVMLNAGHCYAFLGASFPNVSQLDLFLKPNFGPTPPPLLMAFANAPLQQSNETGPAASIGKGQNCFKNPLPVAGAAVIEVKARTGGGPVAVQVFSRNY